MSDPQSPVFTALVLEPHRLLVDEHALDAVVACLERRQPVGRPPAV